MKTIILALATITTALMAGLFYAFAVSVNIAFAKLPDAAYITATQAINVAIVNPAFLVSFLGAPVLLIWAAWLHARPVFTRRSRYILAAAVIFVIGTFGVTVLANIPLNDQLAAFSTEGASTAELHHMREAFAIPWNNWHLVRTMAGIVALVLLVVACLQRDIKS
ncbi:anthrone oxygenase family protein [Chitinophaga sp. OAE865]|uniref:anthrone oxygenase family protein n=1 Tax=Chitinophaga sp. OAE865 TaxID=2817898 RepID=UPI001AEB9E64